LELGLVAWQVSHHLPTFQHHRSGKANRNGHDGDDERDVDGGTSKLERNACMLKPVDERPQAFREHDPNQENDHELAQLHDQQTNRDHGDEHHTCADDRDSEPRSRGGVASYRFI